VGIDGVIPGTDGKNVLEFINELQRSKKELENKISKKLELSRALSSCDEIINSMTTLVLVRSKVPKTDASKEAELETLKEQKRQKEEAIKRIVKILDDFEDKYNAVPDNDRVRLSVLGTKVFQDYDDLKNRIESIEDKVKALNLGIQTRNGILKDIKTSRKPNIKMSKKELNQTYKTATAIARKVNSWIEFIKSIDIDKMTISESLDTDAKIFCDALSDYFADTLKTVYFENQGWKVKRVDFIRRCYLVEGRKTPIGFHDPGTGHTALNSLLTRLKQDYGGKKKILLFDEIGHMSDSLIKRLTDEINKQIDSGEVLLALLTRMDNTVDRVIVEPIK
jgi:hypothetical protein